MAFAMGLGAANPATLADHDGQSMPSRQSAAHQKSIATKNPRSIIAGGREKTVLRRTNGVAIEMQRCHRLVSAVCAVLPVHTNSFAAPADQ